MSFLKHIFSKKDKPIKSYDDFWLWFKQHSQTFYKAVKNHQNVDEAFLNVVASKISQVKSGFYFLAGMQNEHTAELIVTANGVIKNFVFVEEFIAAAPKIPNWTFTALKPALDIEHVKIDVEGYLYTADNLWFYPLDDPNYPDEINICVKYSLFELRETPVILKGINIFLENLCGELNFATAICNLTLHDKKPVNQELIPIVKLKSYLIWREAEFVEKYNELKHHNDINSFTSFEKKLDKGKTLISILNTGLHAWSGKSTHPWMLSIEITYQGSENGLPDQETFFLITQFEEDLEFQLKNISGFLHLGRETGNHKRVIYFACRDFRFASKIIFEMLKKYADRLVLDYSIYKDKYWRTLDLLM